MLKDYIEKNPIDEGQLEKLRKLNERTMKDNERVKQRANYLKEKKRQADKLIEKRKWTTQ